MIPTFFHLALALAWCASGAALTTALHRYLIRSGRMPVHLSDPVATGCVWALAFATAVAAWLLRGPL